MKLSPIKGEVVKVGICGGGGYSSVKVGMGMVTIASISFIP